jgi:hypothetical protein
MGFDFTVAVMPDNTNLDKDLKYVKSALLYADKVRLISPLAYIFVQLTDERNSMNEKAALNLINQIMPLAKLSDKEFYNTSAPAFQQFSKIMHGKQYRALPYAKRLEITRQLKVFSHEIRDVIFNTIGVSQCHELEELVKNNHVIVENFDSSLDNTLSYGFEFFGKLRKSLSSSYPIFDESSDDIMRSVLDSKIIRLSHVEKQKITHAGLADNYLQRLPSFEHATVSEIVDIKKALGTHVVRFRSKMLEYSEQIKSLPWDDDFMPECQLLFDKKIAPTILEIDEATKEGSFVKNLGEQFLKDGEAWQSAGKLAMSIAAPGVIPLLAQVAASDIPAFLTAGSIALPASVIGQKLYRAYSDYAGNKKKIAQNDLYFYYVAGKRLKALN